jgi:aminopeptidase N
MTKRMLKNAAVAGLAVVLATGTAAAANAEPGTPGALSAGERLFPQLGNGGYDARDYDVAVDYRPGVTTMNASVTMRAVSTQALSSFGLDSAVPQVRSVTVDGRAAQFEVKGEKLIVTPARAVARGRAFSVKVDYVVDRAKSPVSPAMPLPPGLENPLPVWENTPDGFAVLGQPDRGHAVFPSNDVPADPATYTLRITTPADVDAVESGTLVGKQRDGDRQTSVFRLDRPAATDVVQIATGHFTEVDQTGPHGLPVRSYVTKTAQPAALDRVRDTPAQVAWLEQTIGRPFPYASAGALGVDTVYGGVALETAATPTYGAVFLADPRETPTQVHELTHQFFGDAVAVHDWDDMWLSEGHAIYYQDLYVAAHGGKPFDEQMRGRYTINNQQLEQEGPVAHLNSPAGVLSGTDNGGALTLFALRNLVGQPMFDRIERTFYDTYRGRSASTQDYIDVAQRLSGRDLGAFFHDWLYTAKTPAMPGHPDWKA